MLAGPSSKPDSHSRPTQPLRLASLRVSTSAGGVRAFASPKGAIAGIYARGQAVMGGEPAEEVRQGGAVLLVEWSEKVVPVLLRDLPDVAEPLVAGRCQMQRVVPAIPPVASGERGLAVNLQSKDRSRWRCGAA
jgi:hypothetical protein